jgi:hypothetical protein
MSKNNRNYAVEMKQVWRLITIVGRSGLLGNSIQLKQQSNNWLPHLVMEMLSLRQKACLAGDIKEIA